jgi:hypothetical protein
MKKPTITQIHAAMKKQNMVVFSQPFSVTLGGIRTKDNVANTFNDWLFASYFDKLGKCNFVILPGTVDPGLSSRLNPKNPKGVAIIQHGVQHRGVYEWQNPKIFPKDNGHKGKEAFRQIKPMLLYRDNNKDEKLDFDLQQELSLSFTNGHDMGTLGKNVNNWSEGCWGSIEKNMQQLYAMARVQYDNKLGRIFSFALLHEKHFDGII